VEKECGSISGMCLGRYQGKCFKSASNKPCGEKAS